VKITLTSIVVNDQAKAHRFYTEMLGFVTKHDIDMGGPRWITLVSPEGSGDIELALEPSGHPASPGYQKALYDSGTPATAFYSSDIHAEYERLVARGVQFRSPPKTQGPFTYANFDDTCGNLIQLFHA
jgi:predicted enzyme related to lactoylglutathione lyase